MSGGDGGAGLMMGVAIILISISIVLLSIDINKKIKNHTANPEKTLIEECVKK